MTVKEAAIQVLNTEAKTLHVKVITDLILSRGLWQTQGKTPAATVEARIASEIKHNGEYSPINRVAPRTYSLQALGAVTVSKFKKAKLAKTKTLSFTNAAEKILAKFGNKQPMHYRDITNKALDFNLLDTKEKNFLSTIIF